MDEQKFLECRKEILQILDRYKTEDGNWTPIRILASAMNEVLEPNGHQARVIIHPLLVYHEVENKI